MFKLKKIFALLSASFLANSAFALVGDTNGDGYQDDVSINGDYIKITDGKTPSLIRSYYIGSGTKVIQTLAQLDDDAGLEVVVSVVGSPQLRVIDDNQSYPTVYTMYRNGSTGNQDYQIRAIDQVNSSPGNELVVMFPGDNFVWIINHKNKSHNNYLVEANPSSFNLIETDGAAGKDVVLGYDSLGQVTIVSTNPVKNPAVRNYHQNVGTSSTRDRIYGFAETNGGAGSEIVLYGTSGSTSISVIQDSSNPYSYGTDRLYNVNGSYQILNVNKNHDGLAGNDICYLNIAFQRYYSLNTTSGNSTQVSSCY